MTATDIPTGDPDADDLLCPVCGYALRGLPEPRCPECGYAFVWAELREKSRLRKGWFYEHAGTLRSHLRTRLKSLRPKRFWAEIHAYTDGNLRRLRWYRLTTAAQLLIVGFIVAGYPIASRWLEDKLPVGNYVTATTVPAGTTNWTYAFNSLSASNSLPYASGTQPGGQWPTRKQALYQYYVPPPVWARWLSAVTRSRGNDSTPWSNVPATSAALLAAFIVISLPLYWRLLRGSAVRSRILPLHLTRVEAYSVDVVPLLLLFGVVIPSPGYEFWTGIGARWTSPIFTENVSVVDVLFVASLPAMLIGVTTWRLRSALRQYVRFPHASPVAIGFAVICGLAWGIFVLRLIPLS